MAGVKPNSTTFVSILPSCAKRGDLEQGMDIHHNIMEGGFFSNIIVGNSLVDMYSKFGSIDKAHELFDGMAQRDVISWNAMIVGYANDVSITLGVYLLPINLYAIDMWLLLLSLMCINNYFACVYFKRK